ncbi:hypothetical protein K8942_05950 [Candidatus Peribacteria bacterium]|nr:MAG: hypothetical protein K8942_05950 [Candidatus Peribacteria bacterium]
MEKKRKNSDVGITEIAMAVFITIAGLLYYHTNPPYQFKQTSSTVMTSTSK